MDPQQYQYLLETVGQEAGRKAWLEHKLKARYVDLSMANLENRALGAYDLSEVNFSTAILRGADLAGADLSDAALNYADMRRVNLHDAVLDRANLDAANLQEANLSDACLEAARLRKTKLAKAILIGADLTGADLSEADLRGASLKYTRLTGARLAGANVAGADLTGAVLDDDAPLQMLNFDQAIVDDRKYRELRSRLTAFNKQSAEAQETRATPPVPPVAPQAASPAPPPGAQANGDNGGNGGNGGNGHTQAGGGTKANGHAQGNGHAAPPHGGASAPEIDPGSDGYSIPIRDKEPDLSTVEGCCRVLGVPANAQLEDVIKAFRAKAKVYHPDKTRHLSEKLQELAAAEFRRLRQAYEALTCRTARPLVNIHWPAGMPHRPSPYDYTSAEYEILAKLNPANTNVLYNLAWKYFDEGRHAKAAMGFQHVLTLNPNDEDAQYNLMMVRLYCEIVLPSLGPGATALP